MMKRKNWYWDIRIPFSKIKNILGREDDPRFPRIAGALLSRVHDPKVVFELIAPAAFCRRFYAIQNEITSDEWTKEKASFWKSTYLRLLKEMKEKGEKIRKSAEISLDDSDKDLIARVRQYRKNALMSQGELAELMGYSQQYVSRIEQGRQRINVEYLKKLAKITHQDIQLIFSHSGN